jgi:hypothetical protein
LEPETGDFHENKAGVEHFGFERTAFEGQFAAAGFTDIETRTGYVLRKPNASGVLKDYPIFLMSARKGR